MNATKEQFCSIFHFFTLETPQTAQNSERAENGTLAIRKGYRRAAGKAGSRACAGGLTLVS